MNLSNLRPQAGSVRQSKRLGRGTGSGGGGTSTRGHKGAQSRSGYKSKAHFEGGQMPLQRRVPKFGFNNFNRVEYQGINIGRDRLMPMCCVLTAQPGVWANVLPGSPPERQAPPVQQEQQARRA